MSKKNTLLPRTQEGTNLKHLNPYAINSHIQYLFRSSTATMKVVAVFLSISFFSCATAFPGSEIRSVSRHRKLKEYELNPYHVYQYPPSHPLLQMNQHGFETEGKTLKKGDIDDLPLWRKDAQDLVLSFISSLNQQRCLDKKAAKFLDDHVAFTDTSLYKQISGKDAILHWKNSSSISMDSPALLLSNNHVNHHMAVDQLFVSENATMDTNDCEREIRVSVLYRMVEVSRDAKDDELEVMRGITHYSINKKRKITSVFDVKQSNSEKATWSALVENTPKLAGLQNNRDRSLKGSIDRNAVYDLFEAANRRDEFKNIGDTNNLGWTHVKSLATLAKSVTVEVEDIFVSPLDCSGEQRVAVRWAVDINGQMQKFGQGCSCYTIENGIVTSGIDILESSKQEEIFNRPPVLLQNQLRDTGICRAVVDSMTCVAIPSMIADASPSLARNPLAINDLIQSLQKRIVVQYGSHRSQIVELFLPEDQSQCRGVVFFIHGGAWGSGKPWMYRPISIPFVDLNMAVAVVGYRTYPSGDVQDQVNDLESAMLAISKRFPHICQRSDGVKEEDWMGVSLIGHSSGAHLGMLTVVQRIEKNNVIRRDELPQLDKVILLSGVYDIATHYYYEAGRGVEEVSPMKPACRYTRGSFETFSPALRLVRGLQSGFSQQSYQLPCMLLLHGNDDDSAPYTQTRQAEKLLRGWGYKNCESRIIQTGHVETATQLMFGGEVRDIVINFLEK